MKTLKSKQAGRLDWTAAIRGRHNEWAAAWKPHGPEWMASCFVADGDLNHRK